MQRRTNSVGASWLLPALRSIGDAVIATDVQGRVVFMNPAAESLTAWPLERARDRAIGDVFVVVCEDNRRPAEDPVQRVLTAAAASGLSRHTLLLARDGTERVIEDSGAPVRDESGELLGVVLVFRDVTERRREERRRVFLARAGEVLGSSLDYRKTLQQVASLAVPHVADWCAIHIRDSDGTVRELTVAHANPEKVKWARELGKRYPPDPNSPRGVYNVLRTGEAELYAEIPDDLLRAGARDAEHFRLIQQLDFRSAMVVPMAARARILGAITFVTTGESGRRLDESDLAIALGLADRAALAVENARLFEEAQRELTERRIAHRALRRQEHLLSTTIRSIGDAVLATDPEGRITFLNPVAEALTGWTNNDARGCGIADVFRIQDERTRDAVEIPVERALRERTVVELANHTVLVRPDGEETPIDDSAAPILDEEGRLLGSVLVFRDVTSRRRAREALERQAQLLELAHDIIIVFDMEQRITFWNRAAVDMYGYSAAEALGRGASDLLKTEFPTSREDVVQTLLTTGRWEGDLTHTRKDGGHVLVASRWALQRDADGEPLAILEICRDITAQRRAETDILALNARLRRAMSETHHRVKNNLQIISALIDLQVLQEGPSVPVGELTRLSQHVRALAAIHDLLTQQARAGANAERVSVSDILNRLLPMIQAVLQNRQINVSADDADLPVRQGTSLAVLLNELVANAAKHASTGDIDVAVVTRNGNLSLEVGDRGPGFPVGFDPEAESSTGLDIVTSLARWDLQGSVTFGNREDGGGRVVVEFPILAAARPDAVQLSDLDSEGAAS